MLNEPELKCGDAVRVIAGALTGLEGTYESRSFDGTKLRIWVGMFGEGTPLQVEFSQVEKIGESREEN